MLRLKLEDDTILEGGRVRPGKLEIDEVTYPSLQVILNGIPSAETLQTMLSGDISVLNEDDSIWSTYTGYTTPKEWTITLINPVTEKSEIEELRAENAALLYKSLTGEDLE